MTFQPRVDAEALRKAQAIAQAISSSIPAEQAGFRLFWMRGGATGWCDLPIDGKPAVLGTHRNCDAVLKEERGLALRHLLVMVVRLDDGPALRMLDLHTDLPFALEDGVPRRSIVASGPVAIALGEYSIVGIPIAEGSKGDFEVSSMPSLPPLITDAREMPNSTRPPYLDRARSDRAPSPTCVTSMPPSMDFANVPRSRRREERIATASRSSCDASVTLVRNDRSTWVQLSKEQLGLGVMLGRGGQCIQAGVDPRDVSISRTHLLLLFHGGIYEAFDICSTQGTSMGGRQIVRQVLPSTATLQMASLDPIIVHWYVGDEAI